MSEPTPQKKRILIVDDNKAIHEDFRKVLGQDAAEEAFDSLEADFFGDESFKENSESFDLEFAFQGEEALEKVIQAKKENRPFSMAFMDVRMPPGWDGIETTQRLWEITPNLQVVICTAYSDYTWGEMVTKLGKSDRFLILKKPFDPVEVVQSAHALVRKSELINENRRYAESLELRVHERTAELEIANQQLTKEINERQRSEEALRFTQFSVDNASEGMFWVAPDASIIYVNSSICQMLNYSAPELRALKAPEILANIQEACWEDFWSSIREKGSLVIECRHKTSDGSTVPVELMANFLARGNKEMLCISSRNISKRMQFLEELSEARDAALESVRMKSRFLANMSHEIRTPMNGIIGVSELLAQTSLDRDQADQLNIIRSSADLLLSIINDILDSSKIESGNLEFRRHNFHIHEAVKGTIDIISSSAHNKRLEINYLIAPDVPSRLSGDSGKLRQVLTNLLGNAVKFTEQGEVTLTITNQAETDTHATLQFEVRDSGIGISETALPFIFEPFKQADDSDTRQYGGTGLGLTICRQIIEALGGSINVESTLGKGSTFYFTMEFQKNLTSIIDEASLEPTEESKRQEITSLPTNSQRILVVEDNPINRKVILLQLKKLGRTADMVENGKIAVEATAAKDYDIILMDCQMPVMDGFTATKIIQENHPNPPYIIAMTANALEGDREKCLNAGMDDYISKPISLEDLESLLIELKTKPTHA